jgi:insertion element IS1 protein InsB
MTRIIRNGKIHNGNPRYHCKNCGRQFVENPPNCRLTAETKPIFANRFFEKISRQGIHRITGVAVSWIPESSHESYHQALLTPLSNKKTPMTLDRVSLKCR